MATSAKQRILTKVLSTLGKIYSSSVPEDLTVLDHLLLAVIQEKTSLNRAYQSYRNLLAGFHDLNELRVSHPSELQSNLGSVPEARTKSQRILDILQFVFETTYTFELESMKRKPLKQAQKQLSKITGTNAFTVAAVVQRSLGGHALPLDSKMHKVLWALSLIPRGEDPQRIRTGMEYLVPKAKGEVFCFLISELANDEKRRSEIIDSLLPAKKRKKKPSPAKASATSKKPTKATSSKAASSSKRSSKPE